MKNKSTREFIDFLKQLKDNINNGKHWTDIKTLINQEIKSLDSLTPDESQTISENKELKEDFCKCINEDVSLLESVTVCRHCSKVIKSD